MENQQVSVSVGSGYLVEPPADGVDCYVSAPPTQSFDLQIVNVHGHGAVVIAKKPGMYSVMVTVKDVPAKWITIICETEPAEPAIMRIGDMLATMFGAVPWAKLGKYGSYLLVAAVIVLGSKLVPDDWVKKPPAPPDDKRPIVDPIVEPTKPAPVKPDPVVTAAKVTIIVVEDTSQKTPAQAAVIMNPMLRASLQKDGHEFELMSVKDPQFASAGYKAYTDKVGLPAVIIFDSGKLEVAQTPLNVFKVPDAPELFEAQVRKVITK